MGLLRSQLFSKPLEDSKLEACLVRDVAHITPGARGEHVKKIQTALNQLSNALLKIDGLYGPKTAAAVKAYKNAPSRRILQPSQTTADDIVGKRTIKSLDDEMVTLEKTNVKSRFVSVTELGAPHDHSTCPTEGVTSPGKDGRAQHLGTPINPQGFGRKINIGGEHETDYLGFQDFVTKTKDGLIFGPPRPLTEDLPAKCASDICIRSSPINPEIRKEISRLALPGCRFTFANNPLFFRGEEAFVLSLGTLVEAIKIVDPKDTKTENNGLLVAVVAMRGDGGYLDLPRSNVPVFPPGRVLREGPLAQVLP